MGACNAVKYLYLGRVGQIKSVPGGHSWITTGAQLIRGISRLLVENLVLVRLYDIGFEDMASVKIWLYSKSYSISEA